MVTSDHWYKNAVIYNLDVEKFQDSNGDGIGDFPGLTRRLDHLSGLGATCLWLQPFYPSPMRDNGYDVTDYYGVDPRHGTLGEFVEFMREAGERGLRVLVDLVANHTSDQHPWFQSARSSPDSPYRDWYVWDEKPEDLGREHVVFPGEQDTIWTFDKEAGAYYLHHFYSFQPDLNLNNPAVRDELKRVMGFWLQLGVSGFRVDAAPFIVEDTTARGTRSGGEEPRFHYLSEFREFLDRRRGDSVLLAEVNVPLDRIHKYYNDGDRFQMLFNFHLNQHLFLALAREDARPLAEALREVPHMPPVCQWANFVRNHDELTLDQLSESERQEIFAAFGPDPSAQIFDRGLRRRLPPMVNGDRRRIELAYSLLYTLPGTPVLRYGEEIGMGDDLSLPGREAVRTAMQWSGDRNAGFSTAPADRLAKPVITGGPFGYERVNVRDQDREEGSLLNHVERMMRTRKRCPEFGWGHCQTLDTAHPAVFAHRADWHGRTVLALHNLAGRPCEVRLDLSDLGSPHLQDLLGDHTYQPPERGAYRFALDPYGYRWFRAGGEVQ